MNVPGASPTRAPTWRRAIRCAGAAAVTAVALAGCGLVDDSPPPAATQTVGEGPTTVSTPEVSPTATSPTPTVPDPTEVSTLPGGNGMALPLLLSDNFLPPAWTATTPRDSGGFRMTICGVDIEPRLPIDGAAKRWQQTPTGPFFEQHVRVYDNNTARDVLAALKEAIPGCREYTATDAKGGSSSFAVSPLTLRSSDRDTVAWRQELVTPQAGSAASTSETPTSSATTTHGAAAPTGTTAAPSRAASPSTPVLTQDVAVTRIGSSTVMLVSYAVGTTPSVALLDGALSTALTLP